MEKLKNKTAFITGGTNGMGFATAQEFINNGAKVIITGRSEKTVNKAVEELGKNAIGIVSNAGRLSDIFELQNQIKKHADKIDVLFVNAGYGKFNSIENVTIEEFDEVFDMLVKGTFFTVQQILPLMPEGSSIILNTTFLTDIGQSNMAIYTAAKAAVQSFIKTFAAECTSKKIRVNGISPGYIATNIFNNTGMSQENIQNTIDAVTPSLPFQRFGEPSEIAKTALFLASDDASYIHGIEIRVDGGLSKTKP
ncbi:SDR family oxidoreductase [Flavobacterium anhuiense]|uniref:SDR family oxidoreductase n=1 Tax=Flavobacterium anhuiense TaxID=459526 RepID=UPI000E6C7A16|nr:SDR family oxidoreductase [Flavobacterium anhuiense]